MWALFRQSLPCRHVIFTVFPYTITPTGCGRPPVYALTELEHTVGLLLCCCISCFFFSILLCFGFLKCAVCFCRCGVFSSVLCFCVIPCVMYFISFSGGGFFFVNDFLVSFFELGHFNIVVFFLFVCAHCTQSSHFFRFLLGMVFFPGVLIKKVAMTHLWSLPMWIMSLASAHLTFLKYSSLGQNVVNLFFFSFWRNERRLFVRRLPEHRVERGVIIYLPTLLHSVPLPGPSSPSNDWNVFFLFIMCFSIVLFIFSMW